MKGELEVIMILMLTMTKLATMMMLELFIKYSQDMSAWTLGPASMSVMKKTQGLSVNVR